MMNSSNDDDFGANPFRIDGSAQPDIDDMFAPVSSQQQQGQFQQQQQGKFQQQQDQFQQAPQFAQPPPMIQQQQQQQQQPQFAQPPAVAVPIQQHQNQQFPPQQLQQIPVAPAPVNPNMPAGLMDTQATMQQQQLPAQLASPTTLWGNCMMCLTFDTYKAYFDIDADDIFTRIRGVFLHFYKPEHFRNNVVGASRTNNGDLKGPDLYGPFWITMTLIFFIGVTANIHGYVHRNDVDEFDYDINHLLHAASILISFSFVLPVILWMTTTCCMAMDALQLVEWICLYGYAMVPFLPAAVLSIVPNSMIAWVTLALATSASCLLVIRNVAPVLMATDTSGTGNGMGGQPKGAPIVLVILGCHFIFFFVLKFTFYHFSPSHHHAAAVTSAPFMAPVMAPVAAPVAAPYAAPAAAPVV
uniref:Protein YIPF n=1 Tax=Pseudo-nitzschia australis TaxID=44445 RepID=A0A7S4EKZ3_9STRA